MQHLCVNPKWTVHKLFCVSVTHFSLDMFTVLSTTVEHLSVLNVLNVLVPHFQEDHSKIKQLEKDLKESQTKAKPAGPSAEEV